MQDRIFRLMTRHQRVDERLRSELARGQPDIVRLLRLKKLKRAVKERLARLTGRRILRLIPMR